MNAILDSTANLWWAHAASMFWQIAFVSLLLGLAVAAIRKGSPTLKHALWLLVVLKLVLPPSLSLMTGIGYWVNGEPKIPQAEAKITFGATSPVIEAKEQTIPAATAIPVRDSSLTMQGKLFCVWAVGILILGAGMVRRTWRLKRSINRSEQITDPKLLALWRLCLSRLEIRKEIRLVQSDDFLTPVVAGFIDPVVVLPGALLEERELDLEPILLHELAHVRRRDVWVNWIQIILQVFYWYHPCVWMANSQIRKYRERACDDVVVSSLNLDRDRYALSLVDMAKRKVSRAGFALGLIGMAESDSGLVGRVKRLKNESGKVVSRLSLWALLAVVILAAVILPWAGRSRRISKSVSPGFTGGHKRQIEIESLFVEIDKKDLDDLGIGSSTREAEDANGERVPHEGQILFDMLEPSRREEVLQKMGELESCEIFGHPKFITLDGKTANVETTDNIPYVKGINPEIGKEEIGYEWAGIKCSFSPKLAGDNDVLLDMSTTVRIHDGWTKGDSDNTKPTDTDYDIPNFDTRSSNVRVRLRQGETVVIGMPSQEKQAAGGGHVKRVVLTLTTARIVGSSQDEKVKAFLGRNVTIPEGNDDAAEIGVSPEEGSSRHSSETMDAGDVEINKKQIEIETRFVEIDEGDLNKLSIDKLHLNLETLSGSSDGTGRIPLVNILDPDELERLLGEIGDLKSCEVLSAPKIRTIENPPTPVMIDFTTPVPYAKDVSLKDGELQIEYGEEEVGIKCVYDVSIDEDGLIFMKGENTCGVLKGRVPIKGPNESEPIPGILGKPIIETRQSEVTVRLSQDHTIVTCSGLMEETAKKGGSINTRTLLILTTARVVD